MCLERIGETLSEEDVPDLPEGTGSGAGFPVMWVSHLTAGSDTRLIAGKSKSTIMAA